MDLIGNSNPIRIMDSLKPHKTVGKGDQWEECHVREGDSGPDSLSPNQVRCSDGSANLGCRMT